MYRALYVYCLKCEGRPLGPYSPAVAYFLYASFTRVDHPCIILEKPNNYYVQVDMDTLREQVQENL